MRGALCYRPDDLCPLDVGNIGGCTGFFEGNLRVQWEGRLAVDDISVAVVCIWVYFSLLAWNNVENAVAVIAVYICPRRGDLEQSVLVLGHCFALGAGDKLVDVHSRRWDNPVVDFHRGDFIGFDGRYWLIHGVRIDDVINLGAPVNARQWLRCYFAEDNRGALGQDLFRFPLEAIGGVQGNHVADCDARICW